MRMKTEENRLLQNIQQKFMNQTEVINQRKKYLFQESKEKPMDLV